jgi:hypothetical protein
MEGRLDGRKRIRVVVRVASLASGGAEKASKNIMWKRIGTLTCQKVLFVADCVDTSGPRSKIVSKIRWRSTTPTEKMDPTIFIPARTRMREDHSGHLRGKQRLIRGKLSDMQIEVPSYYSYSIYSLLASLLERETEHTRNFETALLLIRG